MPHTIMVDSCRFTSILSVINLDRTDLEQAVRGLANNTGIAKYPAPDLSGQCGYA